jgi:hypothetical protein
MLTLILGFANPNRPPCKFKPQAIKALQQYPNNTSTPSLSWLACWCTIIYPQTNKNANPNFHPKLHKNHDNSKTTMLISMPLPLNTLLGNCVCVCRVSVHSALSNEINKENCARTVILLQFPRHIEAHTNHFPAPCICTYGDVNSYLRHWSLPRMSNHHIFLWDGNISHSSMFPLRWSPSSMVFEQQTKIKKIKTHRNLRPPSYESCFVYIVVKQIRNN